MRTPKLFPRGMAADGAAAATASSGCAPGNQVRTACRRDEPCGRLMPPAYATGMRREPFWGNAFSVGDARL